MPEFTNPPIDRTGTEGVGQNAPVPRIVRPTPRPPATVVEAIGVLDSEVKVALIAYFRDHPGPQSAAVEALDVAHPNVSRNVQNLVRAGVLIGTPDPAHARRRIFHVDRARLAELHQALRIYTLAQTPDA